MGRLADSLLDLAGRVKRIEDSAAAVQQRNSAVLKARREELEAAIDREATLAERDLDEAASAADSWLAQANSAIERQIASMRTDFENWRAGLKEKNAEGAAQDAEDEATAAVTLAGYCLDAAEWAVLRAEQARADADELAARR